jgi:hydrogenase maturation protein HypF
LIAARLIINGIVQGVGFRPFVDRTMRRLGLKGYVKNVGGSEVEVFVEGNEENIYEFLSILYNEKPPPAEIEEAFLELTHPQGFQNTQIQRSDTTRVTGSMIPPDFAVCKDCLAEILDPSNHRYMYPFNSCAWCGPRFSMMYTVPYDRENTSMRDFALCESCLKEYSDHENIRRYHAQGISCPRDGPSLALLDNDFNPLNTDNPIVEAAKLIDEGSIIAVKGIGGYHIAASATMDDVVLKLRRRKNRPAKPFAIMGLDTSILKLLVYLSEEDEKLLSSPQAPILLLPKREDTPVSKYISPGLSHEGVFVAYTPLHFLLLMHTKDKFSIMTSGNSTGSPMCTTEECAKSKLRSIADYFLVHNRVIVNRVDDSVVRKTGDQYVFLRRSRGYAPRWIRLKKSLRSPVLGMGGDLSNTFALGFDDKVVISQYIGDLEDPETQGQLINYIDFFVRVYGLNYSDITVIVDKHKAYYSRRIGFDIARKHGCRIVEVQHHYAHLFGTAIDNELEGRIAGIALDGLGWGDDESVWGGEVIVFNTMDNNYERVASIEWVPLTSDRDTISIKRLVTLYLAKNNWSFEEIMKILKPANEREVMEHRLVYAAFNQGRYVKASSTGRVIDVIAALLGVSHLRTYDGEPAIKLEAVAFKGVKKLLENVSFKQVNGLLILDYHGIINEIIDKRDVSDIPSLARSFLYSYGYYIGELVAKSALKYKVDYVVAAGGAVVNEHIYQGLKERLQLEGLKPYLPRRIPAGDGGLSFGQVASAIAF